MKCNLTTKPRISTQILRVVFTMLILVLSSGCQEDFPSSIPITSDTPPPMPTTEVPTPFIEQLIIHIPQGKPLAIDGTMSPGEWDNARVETLSDGSELLLMFNDGYLYLGIQAITTEMIAGNIFINRGDEIAILHSSAALGTALYERGKDIWQQTQAFTWRCRRTDNGETAQAERDAFLKEEHWVAANSRMGTPNELEYKIKMTDETLHLAVNFLRASDPSVKIPWPKDLNDDCILPTPGDLPAQLHFSPDRWAAIDISNSE